MHIFFTYCNISYNVSTQFFICYCECKIFIYTLVSLFVIWCYKKTTKRYNHHGDGLNHSIDMQRVFQEQFLINQWWVVLPMHDWHFVCHAFHIKYLEVIMDSQILIMCCTGCAKTKIICENPNMNDEYSSCWFPQISNSEQISISYHSTVDNWSAFTCIFMCHVLAQNSLPIVYS